MRSCSLVRTFDRRGLETGGRRIRTRRAGTPAAEARLDALAQLGWLTGLFRVGKPQSTVMPNRALLTITRGRSVSRRLHRRAGSPRRCIRSAVRSELVKE